MADATLRDAVSRYVAAFNARDMEALGRLLAEEVSLEDWSLRVDGRAEVLRATAGILEGAPTLRAELRGVLVDGDQAVADLLIGEGGLEVLDLFRFDPAGLIVSIRAFRGAERG